MNSTETGKKVYRCGQNWFRHNLFWSPTSGDMGYDQVVKADPAEDPAFCKVKMFSPVEMDLAFVFAAHRDINKPELMDEWKRQFLSVSFEYRLDDVPISENFELHGIALKHSPLQQIFNILGFKSEWEAKHGTIKSEALSKLYEVSPSFVDTACTMGNRVLKDTELSALLLGADEQRKNPFDRWSKFQYDGVMHGYVNKDATSNRNLQSLTCRVLLAQKACLDLFINFMESDATSWPVAVRQSIKEVTASHNTIRAKLSAGDETWRAGWPESAERFWQLVKGCVYDLEYWSCLVALVKNRRSSNEYLESSPWLNEEVSAIKEMIQQEAKEKNVQLNKHKAEDAVVMTEDNQEDEEDEVDPVKTVLQHMKIGETDKPNLPFKKDAEVSLMSKLNERLLSFKKLAQRKVATCIKWIVEPQPTNENDLVDLYSDTWAKDYHGEWRSLHPGEEPHCTATLLHFFDSKKCSDGRLMKLLGAVARERKQNFAVKQSETIHMLMPPNGLKILKKNRLNYSGTNRGDTSYGVKLPSYDSDTTWQLTFGQKKQLFGKHRVSVGGQAPEGSEAESGALEPAFYHAGPPALDEEIIHCYSVGAINDMTPGDGSMAFLAIQRNLPYIGLVFTDHHAKLLTERLEAMTFEAMQNPKSALFSNELTKLIKEAKKAKPKAKGKAKGKNKAQKADDQEQGEEENEEEDPEIDADEDEAGADGDDDCGNKTPEWINSNGEETDAPSDVEEHEEDEDENQDEESEEEEQEEEEKPVPKKRKNTSEKVKDVAQKLRKLAKGNARSGK
ncbi:unnamed protein product [Cladocopium goreaui]|uniref:Glycosyltransferase-like protein LARGE2 n=1 Tax=Cladocopium goreaui TaxID=2562237 RepID=A0A9P1CKB5_9DINO|nr:unnamed protein product [Cladocopium goreaui]